MPVKIERTDPSSNPARVLLQAMSDEMQSLYEVVGAGARRRAGDPRRARGDGARQPAAMQLYERAGYRRTECYGTFATDPLSVCYEKRL